MVQVEESHFIHPLFKGGVIMKTRIPVFLSLLLLGFMVTVGWGQEVTIAEWNFEDSGKRQYDLPYFADQGTSWNFLNASINVTGALFTAWVTGSGSSGFAPNSNTWQDGFDSKYWIINLNTEGFGDLKLSSKQYGSSTGPRDFKVQWSTDEVIWNDVSNSIITVATNWTSGVLNEINLPSDLNNQSTIFLRWIVTSTTSVNGGTIGSSGTNRIDDILITGISTGPPTQAAAPTFNPPGGTYYQPINVVLSTTTPNGVIYYTDDGSDPDDQSTLYTEPIPLSSTTTLRAITYADELDPSSISTAVYTFPTINDVANVAALRQGARDGTVYRLTGEAFLTFQQSFRNQKYVQDNTAGILIDDDPRVITTTYQREDGITGLIGTLTEFGNMLQFNPVVDPGPATSSGNTVIPLELTVAQFNANFETYEARLVKLLNVSFTATGTFANGQVYGISDGQDAANFRCTFFDVDYIGTAIPQIVLHLIGLPNSRSDGDYITARDLNDFETPSDIAIDAGQSRLPQVFALHQNYPNPFNPATAISYSLGGPLSGQLSAISNVDLSIYNLLGQKVVTLVSERQPAGHYTVQWDASGMVSGVYLYKLQTDNGFSQTRKLVLMK